MKFINRALLFAFALSSVSGFAIAGGQAGAGAGKPAGNGAPSFGEVDKDGNTFVDAEEAKAAGIDIGAADKNYDGRLDRSEWESAAGEAPGESPSQEKGSN